MSSCAKKDVVKPPETAAPPEEEFRLPEVPPAKKPKVAVKKPPHMEAVLIEEDVEDKYILLNFENTDIKTIISTFSELLDINYILTPGVSGVVTIQSYKKFPIRNLFAIFQGILEINGLTAVKFGEFYKIVPIDTAKQQALDIEEGKEQAFRLDSSFVTQLIPLDHVKATDLSNILKALMPRGTDIIIYEPTNMMIVTSLPANLAKFMKIIEALDIPDAESDAIGHPESPLHGQESHHTHPSPDSAHPHDKAQEGDAVRSQGRHPVASRRDRGDFHYRLRGHKRPDYKIHPKGLPRPS
jgi:hypothetical protein